MSGDQFGEFATGYLGLKAFKVTICQPRTQLFKRWFKLTLG